jgi:thiol-disulfide isomerase/thioredoxin
MSMRTTYRVAGTAVFLVAVVAGGCSARDGSQPTATSPVAVRVVDDREFTAALAKYRGKPVLVDYWATWCTACMERFPQTVALHRRLAARGLVTVSLSLDEPEDESKVLKFLRAQDADFENFISRFGGGTESFERFHVGEMLPHVQLFGRDGTLYKSFSGEEVAEANIERAVNELLEKS